MVIGILINRGIFGNGTGASRLYLKIIFSQKMGLLYQTKPYFSDKQLSTIYKSHTRSQMEYCSPVWGGGGSVALGLLDMIQSRAYGLINSPLLRNQLPTLQLRRDVASLSLFHRYFYGHWSDELRAIILPLLLRGQPTRDVVSAHSHSLAVPSCRTSSCKKLVLPHIVKLWNSLPNRYFPENFNLQRFKEKFYNFLLPVGNH